MCFRPSCHIWRAISWLAHPPRNAEQIDWRSQGVVCPFLSRRAFFEIFGHFPTDFPTWRAVQSCSANASQRFVPASPTPFRRFLHNVLAQLSWVMLILGTMENAMNTRQGLHDIALGHLSLELARLRLARPELIKSLEQSLAKFGQLSPIIVRPKGACVQGKTGFAIIDGFKRYHAATALGWESLQANVLAVSRRVA